MAFKKIRNMKVYEQSGYHYKSTERWLDLKMEIVLLSKCEQVWVFGDVISEGMAAEIEKAKKQHKRIRYFTEDLKEVGHEDSLW